ncbi:hypothetical protein [uncultured Maribacter sp.]|uniref:hypothetical protein n=1 Tax=uncultured Maribacter sp. TaxID=431308 RepID=UPI0030ECB38C
MKSLSTLDYAIIVTLSIGLYVSKISSKSSFEFFLSGMSMPWWQVFLVRTPLTW